MQNIMPVSQSPFSSLFQIATFQVILVSDGIHSFALFHYDQIDWVAGSASGASRNTGMGGTGAQVILHQMISIYFLKIGSVNCVFILNTIQYIFPNI